jgi:DNA-binding NarL/FixJ family response regulator
VLGYLNAPEPNLPANAFDELTARERQILELIALGQSNSEIARTLNLSPKTISNNISNVLLKVQATDRAKLMLMALEAGMGKTDKTA